MSVLGLQGSIAISLLTASFCTGNKLYKTRPSLDFKIELMGSQENPLYQPGRNLPPGKSLETVLGVQSLHDLECQIKHRHFPRRY